VHGLDMARSTPTCWKSTRQISTNSLQRSIKQRTSTNTKISPMEFLSFFLSSCSCILCIQLSTVMATGAHSRLSTRRVLVSPGSDYQPYVDHEFTKCGNSHALKE
jgi:hypothetical protein